MEWGTVLATLASAILGGGGVGALFYRKENKRAKQTETELNLAEGWQKLAEAKQVRIEKLEQTIDAKDVKIEELYVEIGQLRNDKDLLSTEVAVLKVYKCEKVGCAERKPPFGSATEFDPSTAKIEKR
jgi:uncharacterized protein HemX